MKIYGKIIYKKYKKGYIEGHREKKSIKDL